MARGKRPIDVEVKGTKGNRQRIWDVIRAKHQGFSARQIAKRAKVDIFTVRVYLRALQLAGYIEQANTTSIGEEQLLRLIKDCGAEAPAITRKGKPSSVGRSNEAMWRSLRILGEVSADELALQASVAAPTSTYSARNFLRWLHWAGYVVESVPSQLGPGGRTARYRLVQGMYTGPRSPMIQRRGQLFDPNLGKVVYIRADALKVLHP